MSIELCVECNRVFYTDRMGYEELFCDECLAVMREERLVQDEDIREYANLSHLRQAIDCLVD